MKSAINTSLDIDRIIGGVLGFESKALSNWECRGVAFITYAGLGVN
jgi:hypothetical protein